MLQPKNEYKKNISLLSDKEKDAVELKKLIFRSVLSEAEREAGDLTPDDIDSLYSSLYEAEESYGEDFALFCSVASDFSPLDIFSAHREPTAEPESGYRRIAYLQNPYADRAFTVFSDKLDVASAVYFQQFKEVFEEVYYGRSDYAIIPISDTRDGQMNSFRKLISKYDLKIAYVTDVEINDDTEIRFALLSKSMGEIKEYSLPLYLDLSIVVSERMKYGRFLLSCEKLGANVISSDSHPSEYSDSEDILDILFDISSCNINALCVFLEASHIRYTAVGIFNII